MSEQKEQVRTSWIGLVVVAGFAAVLIVLFKMGLGWNPFR